MGSTSKPAKPATDRHYYYVDGEQPLVRVTTVISIIEKEFLRYWFAKEERKRISERVVSLLKGEPLSKRAFWESLQGVLTGRFAANKYSEGAIDRGRLFHSALEAHLRGDAPVELPKEEGKLFRAWCEWYDAEELEPLEVEQFIISRKHGYAGTYDLRARKKDGTIGIYDWKRGKRIYPEYHLQNVAYRQAAKEAGLPSDFGQIVRIDPLGRGIEAVTVPRKVSFKIFRAALDLWSWRQEYE